MPERPWQEHAAAVAWDALREVIDPCSIAAGEPLDIVEMGLVRDVRVTDVDVEVELWVTSPLCTQIGLIRERAAVAVHQATGIPGVRCIVDPRGEWLPSDITDEARRRMRRRLPIVT